MSFFLTAPTVIDLGVNTDQVATLRNVRGNDIGIFQPGDELALFDLVTLFYVQEH